MGLLAIKLELDRAYDGLTGLIQTQSANKLRARIGRHLRAAHILRHATTAYWIFRNLGLAHAARIRFVGCVAALARESAGWTIRTFSQDIDSAVRLAQAVATSIVGDAKE